MYSNLWREVSFVSMYLVSGSCICISLYLKTVPGFPGLDKKNIHKKWILEYIHSTLRWKDLLCYFTNRIKLNFNWQYVITRRTYGNSSRSEQNKSISPEKTFNTTFILGWRIQTWGLRSLPACLGIVNICNVHRAQLRHTIRAGRLLFHTPYTQ